MKVSNTHADGTGAALRLAGAGAPAPGPGVAARAGRIARLSAGVVAGGVSFDKPALRSDSLSLHAAPADRNTAATGVALGRVIDVTG